MLWPHQLSFICHISQLILMWQSKVTPVFLFGMEEWQSGKVFATWSNFAICGPISKILVSKCISKVC